MAKSHVPPDTSQPVLETTVGGVLRQVAESDCDRVGLVSKGNDTDACRRWTFGDLLEESRLRGKAWFTLHVLGIAFALCLQSLRSAPARFLCLGALAFAVYVGIYLVLLPISGLLWYPWHRINEPDFWIRVILVVVFSNLLTGMVLGRWVSYRGMNGIVPLVVLWLAVWMIWPFLGEFVHSWPRVSNLRLALAFPCLYLLPLLVGGALARRRLATQPKISG